jgi:hypothetical protein
VGRRYHTLFPHTSHSQSFSSSQSIVQFDKLEDENITSSDSEGSMTPDELLHYKIDKLINQLTINTHLPNVSSDEAMKRITLLFEETTMLDELKRKGDAELLEMQCQLSAVRKKSSQRAANVFAEICDLHFQLYQIILHLRKDHSTLNESDLANIINATSALAAAIDDASAVGNFFSYGQCSYEDAERQHSALKTKITQLKEEIKLLNVDHEVCCGKLCEVV